MTVGKAAGPAPIDFSFRGLSLAILPTTTSPHSRQLVFRVAHRFFRPTDYGFDHLFGLDGPAYIFLSLDYGITDQISASIARTNLFDETEFSMRFVLMKDN